MAHVQDQHKNNAPNPGDGRDSKNSYLRYITGVLLLISGAGVLLARFMILALGASQSMASFVGIVFVALGATFLVTHFEDPDATLTGQAPLMEKIGIYAKGYVLLLAVLLGGGLAFAFYVLDPLETERQKLVEYQEKLSLQREDISAKLKYIEEARNLHETLRTRIAEDEKLSALLASYLNNTSIPMRFTLKCPSDSDSGDPRALVLDKTDDGWGLVRNPSQTRSRENSTDDVIPLEGMSGLKVGLYSELPMDKTTKVLHLSISRESKDGAITALINLTNLKMFGQLCIDQPEKTPEDLAAEQESRIARAPECVSVSGPEGTQKCLGER